MAFDLFILDFDGTFTDVEAEGGPFVTAYREDVARLLGVDVTRDWKRAEAKVREAPERFGWTFDGHVVAPGNADPYLRATVIMNMVFDARGLYADPEERTRVLQRLYFDNYEKSAIVFRPEAKAVVEALVASGKPVAVVTNSATEAVARKLDDLAPAGREKLTVEGNAEKYLVAEANPSDACFDGLPTEAHADGLPRPIYLRRGRYYDVLRRLWSEHGTGPERTLVVGDIYELDLAMPAALGCAAHLITGPDTAEYERAAMRALPRGGFSNGLGAALERAGV
ncbi:MAG: HAD family hydrolase [Deltaproteobacteria bacterium]|nr:HAD family hydrolase [Deltaproteobacteria bacterium]